MVLYDRKTMHKGFLYLYASIPNNIVSIKTIIIMKKLKLFLLSAFLCVGSLAVNSCGDDDEDDAKSSTPSTNDSNVTPNPGGDTNNDKPAPVETKTFTVTFNTDGGSEVAAQTVEDGKTATKPDDPTKERYNFEGWFNGETLYDFASPVTSDLTLTAKWIIKTFTVTFYIDNSGEAVWTDVVEYGKCVTSFEKPSKDGFYFLGWFVGENVYEFTQPVSDDLTVIARWLEKTEYVDLGLPSGTLWATCNVGAKNPWDYGDYFAWGEVTTKEVYNWDTYTARDAPSTLDASHDAATVNMGSGWRMPTQEEFQELLDYCEIEWTSNYNGTGVAGRIVWDTYSHSTHIFFPASGYCYCDGLGHFGLYYAGSNGYYWSSSVDASNYAWEFDFSSGNVTLDGNYRHYGRTVRAVRCR